MSAGQKNDAGKLRWSLLPAGTVEQVIEVLEFGASKYGKNNWQQVPEANIRYYDAAMRHIQAWKNDECFDDESKLPHLAHAACCLLFLMHQDIQDGLAMMSIHQLEAETGFPFTTICHGLMSSSCITETDTDNCNTGDQTEVLPLPTADSGIFEDYPGVNYWRVNADGHLFGYATEPFQICDFWCSKSGRHFSLDGKYDATHWKTWKLDRSKPDDDFCGYFGVSHADFEPQKQQCETETDDLNKHVSPLTKVSTVGFNCGGCAA